MPSPELPRVLSHHAVDRYRQRMRSRKAPVRVIQMVLDNGRYQKHRPAGIPPESENGSAADCYVVAGECVFPMREQVSRGSGARVLVALTCLKFPRLPKAERRAFREWSRDEEWDQWVA